MNRIHTLLSATVACAVLGTSVLTGTAAFADDDPQLDSLGNPLTAMHAAPIHAVPYLSANPISGDRLVLYWFRSDNFPSDGGVLYDVYRDGVLVAARIGEGYTDTTPIPGTHVYSVAPINYFTGAEGPSLSLATATATGTYTPYDPTLGLPETPGYTGVTGGESGGATYIGDPQAPNPAVIATLGPGDTVNSPPSPGLTIVTPPSAGGGAATSFTASAFRAIAFRTPAVATGAAIAQDDAAAWQHWMATDAQVVKVNTAATTAPVSGTTTVDPAVCSRTKGLGTYVIIPPSATTTGSYMCLLPKDASKADKARAALADRSAAAKAKAAHDAKVKAAKAKKAKAAKAKAAKAKKAATKAKAAKAKKAAAKAKAAQAKKVARAKAKKKAKR